MFSRRRIIVIAVMSALGIPVSLLGVQIKEVIFAKQMINCQQDASMAIISMLDGNLGTDKSRDFEQITSNFKNCNRDIDPNMGAVKFGIKEYSRSHSG
ncbi:hypothetical protein ACQK5W_05350 [Pantoea sp. FN060301]|uniref:hypothetical protein n=1 Tax=Pantoea sp. FN060301 TaxID=3420380 RepID=UPI003D184FDC